MSAMALRLVYYAASRGIATLSNLDMQQCPKTFCNNVQKYFAILSKKCLQKTADFAMFTSLMEDEEEKTELEMSGLDPDELEFMDADERRAALEDAGLDPDDYDF